MGIRRPPKKGGIKKKNTNTLLVDGNALFKRGFHGAKDEYNKKGEHIGGIYQFITVVRMLLEEEIYHKVFVFWDGEFSGKLRYNLYPDYKSGRGKDYINGTKPDDERQIVETYIIQGLLDDLYIRQIRNTNGEVEADDYISYYCQTKEKNDKITIVTSDRDLCQLINEDIKIFLLDKKMYVTDYNYNQHTNLDNKKIDIFNFHKDNVVLVKTICGDISDSIRGVKGLGEKTLLKYFPSLGKRKVSLLEIIDNAKEIQEKRLKDNKKPIKALNNLINGITTESSGDIKQMGMDLFNRNKVLTDLTLPMMNEESIEKFNELKSSDLDPDNRGIKEAYKKMKTFGIDEKVGANGVKYLLPFKKLMSREQKQIIK